MLQLLFILTVSWLKIWLKLSLLNLLTLSSGKNLLKKYVFFLISGVLEPLWLNRAKAGSIKVYPIASALIV